MSKDFPNRADWLALRSIRPPAPRLLHASCHFRGNPINGTLNLGRNKAKRLKRAPKAEKIDAVLKALEARNISVDSRKRL